MVFCMFSYNYCIIVYRILVLDNGRIAEFDSPNKLLRDKKGVFHGMAKDANLL